MNSNNKKKKPSETLEERRQLLKELSRNARKFTRFLLSIITNWRLKRNGKNTLYCFNVSAHSKKTVRDTRLLQF